jgi:hypothetical protein
MNFPDDLQRGDILLYGDDSFSVGGLLGRLIRFRTWADVSHVEIYAGNGKSLASRADGPSLNDFYADHLRYVIRPTAPFDWDKGMAWFTNYADKLPYGVADLFRFYNLPVTSSGLICSQFADLYFQQCGLYLFNPNYPAGSVSPRDYELLSPMLARQVYCWQPVQTDGAG